MRENCSILYPNELIAQPVTEYADNCSVKLHDEVCRYHDWALAPQRPSCYIMTLFQARFLTWMARSMTAKRVLEIGSSVGFSLAMWSHAISPDGLVTGLESSAECVKTARERLAMLPLRNVEIVEGDALSLLSSLGANRPYDVIFINTRKSAYPTYLQTVLGRSRPGAPNRLLRSGGLIIADNKSAGKTEMATETTGILPTFTDETDMVCGGGDVKRLDDFNSIMHANPRIEAVLMPVFDGLGMGRLID